MSDPICCCKERFLHAIVATTAELNHICETVVLNHHDFCGTLPFLSMENFLGHKTTTIDGKTQKIDLKNSNVLHGPPVKNL